jgi:hypothetical protein
VSGKHLFVSCPAPISVLSCSSCVVHLLFLLRSSVRPSSVHSHPYLSCLAIFPPLLSASFRAPLTPYSPLYHSLKHNSPWTDSLSPPCCCLFLLFLLPVLIDYATPNRLFLPSQKPWIRCFPASASPIFPIACELLRGILYTPTLPTILTSALCRLYFVFCCVSFFAIEYNLFYSLYRFSLVSGLCSFPPCCCCCSSAPLLLLSAAGRKRRPTDQRPVAARSLLSRSHASFLHYYFY